VGGAPKGKGINGGVPATIKQTKAGKPEMTKEWKGAPFMPEAFGANDTTSQFSPELNQR